MISGEDKKYSNYKGIKKYDQVSLWGKIAPIIIKEVVDNRTFLDDENSVITINQIHRILHHFPNSKTVNGIKRTLQYGLLSDITQKTISPSHHKVCIFLIMQKMEDEQVKKLTEPFVKRKCTTFYLYGKQDESFRKQILNLYPSIALDVKRGDFLSSCRVWEHENKVFDEGKMQAYALESAENNAEFTLLLLFRHALFSSPTDIFFATETPEIIDRVMIHLAEDLSYEE